MQELPVKSAERNLEVSPVIGFQFCWFLDGGLGWGTGRFGLCKINCIDRREPKGRGVEGSNETD
jgi:hypothetical protein